MVGNLNPTPATMITIRFLLSFSIDRSVVAIGSSLCSQIGVFIGVSGFDYNLLLQKFNKGSDSGYVVTGNAGSICAGRISYTLGLEGPSIAIDTACSSSLVAVNLAYHNLEIGKSKLAIVGGVNAITSFEITKGFANLGVLALDGKCKSKFHV